MKMNLCWHQKLLKFISDFKSQTMNKESTSSEKMSPDDQKTGKTTARLGKSNFLMQPSKLRCQSLHRIPLELARPSTLIKDNAELQGSVICQRVFHFLPLWDDADWREKEFPEDKCLCSPDQSLLAVKTERLEVCSCYYHPQSLVSSVHPVTRSSRPTHHWGATRKNICIFPLVSSKSGFSLNCGNLTA